MADDAVGLENKKLLLNEELVSSILDFVTIGALPLLHFMFQLPGYPLRLTELETFVTQHEPAEGWIEEATVFFARVCEPVLSTAAPQRSTKAFGVGSYPQRAPLIVYNLIRAIHGAYQREAGSTALVLAEADRSANKVAICYAAGVSMLQAQAVAKEEQENIDRMTQEMLSVDRKSVV